MTFSTSVSSAWRGLASIAAMSLAMLAGPAYTQTTSQPSETPTATDATTNNGNRSPDDGTPTNDDSGTTRLQQTNTSRATQRPDAPPVITIPRYVPGEFEQYVRSQVSVAQGEQIRRFGSNLLTDIDSPSSSQDPLATVPGGYVIKPGDEVALTIWGSVDANLRLTVDRSGAISVPRVGAITVAGLRYADLAPAITRRVGLVFKNFELSATLGQLRAVRVFVSGYAQRPGSITVSGLSSVLHALMRAGGPSAAGSFRDIRLNRGGKQVASYDLYDLLLSGARGIDALVQADDVIFIGPVGPQVAVVGSVNVPAIFELKAGESLSDVLHMAGGFTAVADRSRVSIERLVDRDTGRVTELALPANMHATLGTGDLVRAYSAVTAELPKDRQNKRVHIDGEVARPGDYVLPPGSRISDALRAAGGMTTQAYPYGAEFTRETVRRTQQLNYDRALRDLETDMTKQQASQRTTSADEAATQSASATANARFLERLRQIKPTGRVVLQLTPDAKSLPDLALEDGDSLNLPTRSSSVGVFGSVFNTGSFEFAPSHSTEDYIRLAGGPTRGADKASMFVIRANGSVVSAQQGRSFWHSGSQFQDTQVEPGDTIFVPEELNKSTFVQDAKDWTQILYQFGLGLAGIKSLGL